VQTDAAGQEPSGDRPGGAAGADRGPSVPGASRPTARPDAGREPGRRGRLRALGRLVLFLLGLAAAVGFGVAAVVGLALLTADPVLLLGGGWLVHAALVAGAVRLAATRPHPGRRRLAGWTAGALAVTTAVGAVLFFLPSGSAGKTAPAVPGAREVTLSTGSRIGYAVVRGTGARRAEPVVFLHGGPGVADLAGDLAYFRQLAADGFDVYVYDQFGAGRSERADDPRQYTVQRAVADLEAFRREVVGGSRMNLIAHSWGATIASSYLAEHSRQVAKVVFSSPGTIYARPRDTAGNGILTRLTLEQKVSFYAALLAPRNLLVWTLVQVNPAAAHRLAGDREMDARFDEVYARSAPGLYCDTAHRDGHSPGSLGFYANAVPLALSAERGPDPHAALREVDVPALVVKGSCDYLPWSMVVDYRTTLPDVRVSYLDGAGHQAYVDRPAEYLATVRAFLLGRPLPVPPLSSDAAPANFEGPQ
jgi:proline iminopeptidase